MQVDRNGLEVLSRAQCLRLLGRARVGRVVVTDRALPAAFPVNFALLDEDVVFLTASGSKLEAASAETVVAFEVDEIDLVNRAGWSVLIQGTAGLLEDPEELARVEALDLEPWAPVARAHVVRVRSELLSGRRLVPAGTGTAGAGDRRQRPGRRQSDAVARPDWAAGCPNCGSQELLPVSDGMVRNFVCTTCAACWHLADGRLGRVDPAGCPGCPFKPMCTTAAARDRILTTVERARRR